MTRKYHNHTLQTKTRPDIIVHFIKQRNQFQFERKLYAQKCVSVSVPFVPNVVVQHVSGFVACCVEATHYKWKVPSYLWVMWHTMLVSAYAISVIVLYFEVQSQDIIIRRITTSPFKSMYFQIFWQNYCRKTIEDTTAKKVPNERKWITQYTI